MIIQNFILSLVVLILASLLAEPLSRLLRLPFVAILIVVGYFGSEIVVNFGYDTGIRASNFPLLVLSSQICQLSLCFYKLQMYFPLQELFC